MATVNAPARSRLRTHEGGTAVAVPPLQALRRSVLTCLLWENTFYEKGDTAGARIAALVAQCTPEDVAALAIEARTQMQLRHVPLLLVRELARVKGHGPLVERTLRAVIQRPDEMTEYLALYWKDGRCPVSAGSKRALRDAFGSFSRYQLAKYRESDKAVKLVDVLRLVRPAPVGDEQAETYRQLRKGELVSTDTWESELSAGKGKKETFEQLIQDKKLGAMATLKNLRNMQTAGVSDDLIRERLAAPMPRVWPYRYVTAAKYAPSLEDALETAMLAMLQSVADIAKLPGKTGLLIDVSGSMDYALSPRSKNASMTVFQREMVAAPEETSRVDVAAGLAILLREKADNVRIATFSQSLVAVPPRRGFALRDAIKNSQMHGGTYLAGALKALTAEWRDCDRVIVITDEQSHDGSAPAWTPNAYIINVASYEHGVGDHAGWTKIHGWSERVFDYIAASEASRAA
jgi:hypothetical protein